MNINGEFWTYYFFGAIQLNYKPRKATQAFYKWLIMPNFILFYNLKVYVNNFRVQVNYS